MDFKPGCNLYNYIREQKLVPHKKRQEFFSELVQGVIRSRSVVFSEIADKIDRDIKTSSIERRIQDFFHKVEFDYEQITKLLCCFVPHQKITLSIDRTEWDYGKTQINILCVIASVGKMGVPLYFEMLDNNSGNSNHLDRINLFTKLINYIGKERVGIVLMDREFIGHHWFRWLKDNKIDFCVRVPKHHKILFADGEYDTATNLQNEFTSFEREVVAVNMAVVSVSISSDKNGDLLYLVGTCRPNKLKKMYKKRWTIEVLFQALKERGFNIEKSCLRDLNKYRKLFAIVSIAYAICWFTGIENGKINPVRCKNHGYPQNSVFRRGLDILREEIKRGKKFFFNLVMKEIEKRYALLFPELKTVG